MIFEAIEYKVAEHFLPYLVNGDDSGLEPDEVAMVDEWLSTATVGWSDADGHDWVYAHESVDSGDSEFAECEVCCKLAMCQTVKFHFTPESV